MAGEIVLRDYTVVVQVVVRAASIVDAARLARSEIEYAAQKRDVEVAPWVNGAEPPRATPRLSVDAVYTGSFYVRPNGTKYVAKE